VAWPRGAKRPRRVPSTPSPKSHSLTAPPGFLLDHEGQALGEAIVGDHGIGAGPNDSRHGEERELARLEVEGALEIDVEGRHVVGEPAQSAYRSREGARGRGARLALFQWHRDLERAIPMGHATGT